MHSCRAGPAAGELPADADSPPETATLFLFMSTSFLQEIA